MKKNITFAIAMLILSSTAANSYVDNEYMTSPQFMLNTGYSTEMSKMLDVIVRDPYREPYQEPKNAATIWKRIYGYVAPTMQTDLTFYNRDINYNKTDWKDF